MNSVEEKYIFLPRFSQIIIKKVFFCLHDVADGLPLREYFRQVLGAQDVSQGGGGKEARRVAGGKSFKILIHFSI